MSTHYLAFDKEWFIKNQRLLLWLLNTPIIKSWFRWVLRIRQFDCSLDKRIIQILPNNYTVFNKFVNDKIELTTEFRTHPKFGKRIYYAFRPLWWIIHAWDWAIADRFIPRWSYGFSTLTAFPDAGTGATTVDGFVGVTGVDVTLASIRGGTGTTASTTGAIAGVAYLQASTTTNQFKKLIRGFFTFDTSTLTSGATISAAVFSVFGNGILTDIGTPNLVLVQSTQAASNALATTDYTAVGSTSFASIAFGSLSTVAYNDFTCNASGISNVSKTGISQFALITSWDLNNSFTGTWVSNAQTGLDINYADTAGTSNDPKLVVTYTLGGSFPPFIKLNQAVIRSNFY